MSAIIRALFGIYPEPELQNITVDVDRTLVEQGASSTSEHLQALAVVNDVQVQSVISSDTQANATLQTKSNLDALFAQLNTTHAQVDQYSRARTAEINEQMQQSIADVLAHTQCKQEELVQEANRRQLIIDNEYKLQLHKAIEALDTVKARALADLERDLQVKQQTILNAAKEGIDRINDQAQIAKLSALIEVQEQAKQNIDYLADQIAAVGQLETQTMLQSTTTTVITSQTQATENAETQITTPAIANSVLAEHPREEAGTNSSQVSSAANLPETSDTAAVVVPVPIASIEAPIPDVTSQSPAPAITSAESIMLPDAVQTLSNSVINDTDLNTKPTNPTS